MMEKTSKCPTEHQERVLLIFDDQSIVLVLQSRHRQEFRHYSLQPEPTPKPSR